MGVALAVDIDLLRKSQRIPAGLSLLRESDHEVDLIVGYVLRRGADMCSTEGATGRLDVDTISHRYHLALFPNPDRRVPEGGPAENLVDRPGEPARPLEQSGYEFARRIYPGALDRLWKETVLDGRRVGPLLRTGPTAGTCGFRAGSTRCEALTVFTTAWWRG